MRPTLLCACFATFVLLWPVASFADINYVPLYTGINQLRLHQCRAASASMEAVEVSPHLEAAARDRAAGVAIAAALSESSVQFSSAEVLVVGGDLPTALARLASRHCAAIGDRAYTHVGAAFLKQRWWVVLATLAEAAPASQTRAVPTRLAPEEIIDAILLGINVARATPRICGESYHSEVPPVVANDILSQAARHHAEDMIRRQYFAHNSPEGETIADRVRRFGYQFGIVGENIAAMHTDNLDLVIAGWLNSTGHCANIMNGRFSEMGAAMATLPDSRQSKWVLVLGAPR